MKILSLVLVVMFVFGLVGMVEARDIEEVAETVYDTVRGENSSCPSLVSEYVAKTWEDRLFFMKNDLVDTRLKLEYTHSIRSLTDDNSVKLSVGLEL